MKSKNNLKNTNQKGIKNTKKNPFIGGFIFLTIVCIIYCIVYFNNKPFFYEILNKSKGVFIQIVPILIFVFVIMATINYFITTKKLVKIFEKSRGVHKWIYSIVAGIISTGPMYLWYPLLSELKEHGMRNGYIATFLYARSIKPALFPIMIFYFGISYTIVISASLIVFSYLQGKLIDLLKV